MLTNERLVTDFGELPPLTVSPSLSLLRIIIEIKMSRYTEEDLTDKLKSALEADYVVSTR